MASKDKYTGNLIFAVAAAALGSGFQHGYHTAVINVPSQVLQAWLLTTHRERYGDLDKTGLDILWGLTTSIMNIGGAIGGCLTAVILSKIGPKVGLFLNNVLVVLATIFMFFSKMANSFEMMIIGRLIIGINAGINAGLCPMYLSEISPLGLRGAISSTYQLVITVSILLSSIFGLYQILGSEDLWPYLFLSFPLLFAIFQAIALWFCSESPRYLVSVSKITEAEDSLKFLRQTDDVSGELAAIKAEDDAVKALPKVTIKDMFKSRHLKIPLLIAVMIMLAQQLSGINAIIFYSTFILSVPLKEDAVYGTIGIFCVNVVMTVVSVFLVDKAGRKTLLLIGFGGMAIVTLLTCILFVLHYEQVVTEDSSVEIIFYVILVLIFAYIILFAAGAGSIPWFLVSEIFNQEARPTAISVAIPTNWIANFLVTITFPLLEGQIGPYVFLIFAVMDVLFFVFIWKVVPETKNKTVEEITSQWK